MTRVTILDVSRYTPIELYRYCLYELGPELRMMNVRALKDYIIGCADLIWSQTEEMESYAKSKIPGPMKTQLFRLDQKDTKRRTIYSFVAYQLSKFDPTTLGFPKLREQQKR